MTYNEWLRAGMALHFEGFGVEVWDDWSQTDPARYHPGECQQKWATFGAAASSVTGRTIIRMAIDSGWVPPTNHLNWNDIVCASDDDNEINTFSAMSPNAQLTEYIHALFRENEYICYSNHAIMREGKYGPNGGTSRAVSELLEKLSKYPNDITLAIGDYNKDAGAWICINPTNGLGRRAENIVVYRHALVESDNLPVHEQISTLKKLRVPITALVSSGNKSVHAIVRVDAHNAAEYRDRVQALYDILDVNGFPVDRANSNPSRLSRMPGVIRNGKEQQLLGINMGCVNFSDWIASMGESARKDKMKDAEMPPIHNLPDLLKCPPPVPPAIIDGILRQGHKMLIAGPSKAGKSFLLMQLAIAIAEGGQWLSYRCKQGHVLYVNLEIDDGSCVQRFADVIHAQILECENIDNVDIWNLRGHSTKISDFVPQLLKTINKQYDAIILDPIYKINEGDENSASEMADLCRQIDVICRATGAAVIFCHHHSKGAQGDKKTMDRPSGSGVFARDPDALLDIIELETDGSGLELDDGESVWRLDATLREFPPLQPITFVFRWPVHDVDNKFLRLPAKGTFAAGQQKNGKCKTAETANAEFDRAFDQLNINNKGVAVEALSHFLSLAQRTIRDRVQKSDKYKLDKGLITRI